MNRMIKYGLLVTMFFMASCGDFLEPKSQSEYVPKLVKSLDELLLGEVYMGPGYSDGQFYGTDQQSRRHRGESGLSRLRVRADGAVQPDVSADALQKRL